MSVTTASISASRSPSAHAASAAAPRVLPVDQPALVAAWERYVRDHADGTLFHLPDWSASVAATIGGRARHLVAVRGEQVVGVLPLIELNSLLAGRLLVSIPYATYGGVVADDVAASDALAAEAIALTQRSGARSLDLRSRTPRVPGLTPVTQYASFCRELPATAAELETFLPRKARAAARQAERRENLQVLHNPTHLDEVWMLYARSMRRLGSLAYPRKFFRDLVVRLKHDAWVTLVHRDSQPIAGLLSFVFRDTVLPYFLGVDERVRCTGATNLIYRAVMERAVAHGLRWFDFGRTRKDNAGPFEFKVNQGFTPQTLGYQRYTPPNCRPVDLTPANPRFALARRIWKQLPLAVTTRVGGWLASSVPG